jgi:hypothetical protein
MTGVLETWNSQKEEQEYAPVEGAPMTNDAGVLTNYSLLLTSHPLIV